MTTAKPRKSRQPVRFASASSLATIMTDVVSDHGNLVDLSYDEDSIATKWYDASEMGNIRNTALQLAMSFKQLGMDTLLQDVFSPPKQLGASGGRRHKKDYHSQAKLIHWTTHGHSSRGIEALVNMNHGQLRASQRRFTIQQVLRAQAKCRKVLRSTNQEKREKYISYVSMHCSQPAVAFASMLGGADALAAHYEYKKSAPPLKSNDDASCSDKEASTTTNQQQTLVDSTFSRAA